MKKLLSAIKCSCCSREISESVAFKSVYVSSDSHSIINAEFDVSSCEYCGHIFKIITADLRNKTKLLYDNYRLNHQSKHNAEQKILGHDGCFKSRTDHLLRALESQGIYIDKNSNILDYGCGDGITLENLQSKNYRNLSGYDPNFKKSNGSLNDRGFDITNSFENFKTTFDFILSIHCLEHVDKTSQFFKDLHKVLKEDGTVIVQVPNIHYNPVDFLIYDHFHHFSIKSLSCLSEKQGFKVLYCGNLVNRKEITIILKKPSTFFSLNLKNEIDASKTSIEKTLPEIKSILRENEEKFARIRRFLEKERLKAFIFGSSITAAIATGYLGGLIEGYIDEDQNREGQTFHEKPIISPNSKIDIPVILPIPEELRRRIIYSYGFNKNYSNANLSV